MRSRTRAVLLALCGGCAAAPAGDSTASRSEKPREVADAGSDVADAAKTVAAAPPTVAVEPAEPARVVEPPAGYVAFAAACEPGKLVTIAAIGDVLMHHELQKQAYAATEGFGVLWSGIADLLARADVTYANLEVPIAKGLAKDGVETPDPGLKFDNVVYTGYPFFNAHPRLAGDLAEAGVDVVSTANNHSLDRGGAGIDRTLDALDAAKLAHTGTRRTGTKDPWHAVTTVGGLRIGWVACTLHTNFGKDTGNQVLDCFKETPTLLKTVRGLATSDDIDVVIATPHWGKEYAHEPQDKQRKLAKQLVDAGATAVLGAHPHVLQPMEKMIAADGREAFVIWSLGNFAHHQRSLDRRSSAIVYLALRQRPGGEVVPAGVGYVPIHVRMEGDKEKFFVEAIDRAGGPADAREHVVGMLGAANVLDADTKLDLVPYCAKMPPR